MLIRICIHYTFVCFHFRWIRISNAGRLLDGIEYVIVSFFFILRSKLEFNNLAEGSDLAMVRFNLTFFCRKTFQYCQSMMIDTIKGRKHSSFIRQKPLFTFNVSDMLRFYGFSFIRGFNNNSKFNLSNQQKCAVLVPSVHPYNMQILIKYHNRDSN